MSQTAIRKTKETLQSITHKAFGSMYARYGFVLPNLYEVEFGKQVEQSGMHLEQLSVPEELKHLLDEIEEASKQNQEHFTLLADYSSQALDAMNKESKKELESVRDKTEDLLAHIKELERKAYHDEITGLLNRSGFRKMICNNSSFHFDGALFFIDLDKFKQINDTYGHQKGNAALKAFADLIKRALSSIPANGKFMCRAGGDEFLIAVKTENVAYAKAQLLVAQQKNYCISIGITKETVGFSFGDAFFHEGEQFEDIVAKADASMYQNKKKRKGIECS